MHPLRCYDKDVGVQQSISVYSPLGRYMYTTRNDPWTRWSVKRLLIPCFHHIQDPATPAGNKITLRSHSPLLHVNVSSLRPHIIPPSSPLLPHSWGWGAILYCCPFQITISYHLNLKATQFENNYAFLLPRLYILGGRHYGYTVEHWAETCQGRVYIPWRLFT